MMAIRCGKMMVMLGYKMEGRRRRKRRKER
jgi:hypothetical protein